MYSYNKHFFTMTAAKRFVKNLENNGITEIALSSRRDAFNQADYIVSWNVD